jgi:molybdopterin biosynthesis enzyme
VRVATGSALPALADAVVPLAHTEDGAAHAAKVTVARAVPSKAYVRRVGEDVQTGDVAVRPGAVIGAAQVGLLAALGRAKVLVHPRPRLSVLSVGEELLDVDRTPSTGQVYDINSYALAAAGRDAGAEVHRVGIVSSEPSRLREAVEGRLLLSEIVVVTGAVGGAIGEQLCDALGELGPLDVERVAMHHRAFAVSGDVHGRASRVPAGPVAARSRHRGVPGATSGYLGGPSAGLVGGGELSDPYRCGHHRGADQRARGRELPRPARVSYGVRIWA